MRKHLRLATALLLALLLAVSSVACKSTTDLFNEQWSSFAGLFEREASVVTAAPVPSAPETVRGRQCVPFSEMVYERPDTEAIAVMLDGILADLARGEDIDVLLDRYDAVRERYNAADSALSLLYVLYAQDVTDTARRDAYNALCMELNALDLSMTEVSLALLARSEDAEDRWGDAYAEAVIDGADLNSEAIQPLIERDLELTADYDALYTSFVLWDGGRSYTFEEIDALAEWDYDTYLRLFDAYYEAFNREAGQIFLAQLAIRSDIAETLGYADYAAYEYACYGRDYSIVDVKRMQETVKRRIVPLYTAMTERIYRGEIDFLYESYPLVPYLKVLRNACYALSTRLIEPIDYMLRYGLYDLTDSAGKMQTSFTTYFSAYDAPFLFHAWTDSFDDTATVIHELGHYANYYHNAAVGWSESDPLDLAEVDSQGLEMLMLPYYPSFYGEDADTAALYRLSDALYALLSGCMEDEFQQTVYADPDMTLYEINALYLRLAEEYGFADLYGYTGTEWTRITHTFQSPMYYISYAVSVVPALELWELARENLAQASRAYFRILDRAPYARFRETVKRAGLSDPLLPETIERIADVLERVYGN